MDRGNTRLGVCALGFSLCAMSAHGAIISSGILLFDGGNGLAAEAEFWFDTTSASILNIRLQNTSTTDGGFGNAGQILTAISWDFGDPGFNGDPMTTGGTVVIGPNSQSLNFDTGSYGAGADVSGEYGYGNMDGTGAMTNFVSSNVALATAFGGANLDGPVSIDGPQGGLVANPLATALGGLGAIQDEILITLQLTESLFTMDMVLANGARVEFGSDAFFITIPAPGSASIFGIGIALFARRRR
jgi:hypothetical protein